MELSSGTYIPYAELYIPVTYLFYSWKFEPLNPLHRFHPCPHPFPLATTGLFPLFGVYFCFVCSLVLFLDYIYKRNYTISVFPAWLISLWVGIMSNGLSVHPYCHKGQDFILFYGGVIFQCVCVYVCVCVCVHTYILCLPIYLYMDTGCFHIPAIINNAAINIGVHISLWINAFVFLG